MKEGVKLETNDSRNETHTGEADVNMQDANGAVDTPAAENGAPESGEKTSAEVDDKPLQMDTDDKVCSRVVLVDICCELLFRPFLY